MYIQTVQGHSTYASNYIVATLSCGIVFLTAIGVVDFLVLFTGIIFKKIISRLTIYVELRSTSLTWHKLANPLKKIFSIYNTLLGWRLTTSLDVVNSKVANAQVSSRRSPKHPRCFIWGHRIRPRSWGQLSELSQTRLMHLISGLCVNAILILNVVGNCPKQLCMSMTTMPMSGLHYGECN